MTVYTYTGKLTDFGESPFPGAIPRLYVAPKQDAFSPTGPSAARLISAPVASDGSFSVDLQASIDLIPPTQYSLRCDWILTTTGADVRAGWAQWDFTAQPGGGSIATMPNKLTRVWYGADMPPINRSGIYWVHSVTGDVREWR